MTDAHEHSSPIKTPQQLIVVIAMFAIIEFAQVRRLRSSA